MGWICSTYGGREARKGVWWGHLTERDHLEDLSIDLKMILKWLLKKWDWEA
jgi:hypothetical protein